MNSKNYPQLKKLTGAYRLYISPIIALFGIIGNILVITIFLLEHKKSRFSIYCIAISGTHIIILIFNTFIDDFLGEGLKYRNSNFYFKVDTYSIFSCHFMEYIHNSMYTASSGLLLVFSVDRIVTIFRPMQFYSIHYRRFAIYTCLFIIFIGTIINIPLLISSKLNVYQNKSKCHINDQIITGKVSIHLKVFVTFIVPTFIILFLNVIICLKLWRAKIQRAKLCPGDLQKNNLEMNRICGHLALNSMFLLFTFPLVISMILRQVEKENETYIALSKLFSSIKDISYALDFLLYFIFLTNFRWRFIKYFIAPILRGLSLKGSRFGIYVESKLMKYDSNSSRRKYSAIAAALSSCNNHQMFSALMCKSNLQLSNYSAPLRQCISYTPNSHHNSIMNLPYRTQRSVSIPKEVISFESQIPSP